MSNAPLVVNATRFFSSESYVYSFGSDIKFKKPIPLNKMMYSIIFLIGWALPQIYLFGLNINLVYIAWLLAPPLLLANVATRPMFMGKNLFDFVNTMIEFVSEPKGSSDWWSNPMKEETYEVSQEIWISRRRELNLLADIIEGKVIVEEENDEVNVVHNVVHNAIQAEDAEGQASIESSDNRELATAGSR